MPVQESRNKLWSDLTQEDIDQIWAEAVTLYRNDEPRHLDDDMATVALDMQLAHTEESSYTGQIINFLEKKITSDWYSKTIMERKLYLQENSDFDDEFETEASTIERTKVCALEIWCECLGKDRGNFPAHERREINNILCTIPGWKRHKSSMKFGSEYGTQRAFIREV